MSTNLLDLSSDIVGLIALQLDIKDIFILARVNKRFYQNICNNKSFWQFLFLREIKEKVDIPLEADID